MTNTNSTRPAAGLRKIMQAACATCVVADGVIDDARPDDYICDAIMEQADACTSIYYSDILRFISEHPQALADVVAEGLYEVDVEHPYDLYKHGQAAEFMTLEHEAYEHLADIHHGIAAYYLLYVHELKEIPADTWDEIKAAIDADTPDTYGDIWETVDAIISPDDEDDGDEDITANREAM